MRLSTPWAAADTAQISAQQCPASHNPRRRCTLIDGNSKEHRDGAKGDPQLQKAYTRKEIASQHENATRRHCLNTATHEGRKQYAQDVGNRQLQQLIPDDLVNQAECRWR